MSCSLILTGFHRSMIGRRSFMHIAIVLVVLGIVLCGCQHEGRETRHEIVRTTTPEEDAKPNSDQVPNVYAIKGKFDRVLVLRFKYQTDLLAGIEQMVKQHNIRNAVILFGIGSVRSVHYHSVSNRTFPS